MYYTKVLFSPFSVGYQTHPGKLTPPPEWNATMTRTPRKENELQTGETDYHFFNNLNLSFCVFHHC